MKVFVATFCKEGSRKMWKPLVIAVVLAVGATAVPSAIAAPNLAVGPNLAMGADHRGLVTTASRGYGCLGEPDTWLPGTLQIDGPTASAGEDAKAYDCALA